MLRLMLGLMLVPQVDIAGRMSGEVFQYIDCILILMVAIYSDTACRIAYSVRTDIVHGVETYSTQSLTHVQTMPDNRSKEMGVASTSPSISLEGLHGHQNR